MGRMLPAGVEEHISKASWPLGPPVMKCVPDPGDMRTGDTDRKIIDALRKDPAMPVPDLSRTIVLSGTVVRKRLELMERNRMTSVIAEVNLTKIDAVLYSVISGNINDLLPGSTDQVIFLITDRDNGILVSHSDNMKSAREQILG
ncbi:hypothetical protein IX51_01505 [uncultured archaeon]|nr:hypothetical protein IX51_01505 [uncultured archaeon]